MCLHSNIRDKLSQKTHQIYCLLHKWLLVSTYSYHQANLNHLGTLSGSAHVWDPKMFTIMRDCRYKCGSMAV
jgi:hypothetical protein